jgi:predicted pyridoxine 5'-phosphate oxidase superfamily flavin-nucleotide-binding protein
MDTGSAFHAGEQALQARAGVRQRLEAAGRSVIRDHMPEQHRELFAKLPTLLLAVQDDLGQPWATMLHGPGGFISSPDARTLHVRARPAGDDPVSPWLTEGAAVGLLGLEPHTRRRNRANGRVRTLHEGGFEIDVLQSFGNCPKYIHARHPETRMPTRVLPSRRLGPLLDANTVALLRRADTLFIASASAARPGAARGDGVDVSHRGGRPGFVRVALGASGGVRLTVPDYVGNFFFNTLGNLNVWPRAGLLVPDFDDGSLLHLAATASIQFEGPALDAFPGAQRLLHLDVREGRLRPEALPLRWTTPEMPPQFAA